MAHVGPNCTLNLWSVGRRVLPPRGLWAKAARPRGQAHRELRSSDKKAFRQALRESRRSDSPPKAFPIKFPALNACLTRENALKTLGYT